MRVREAVAEEKAVLVLQLHQLCRRPPSELAAAGVIATRYWVRRLEAARRVKGDPRASVRQLQEAICDMQMPFPAPRLPAAD